MRNKSSLRTVLLDDQTFIKRLDIFYAEFPESGGNVDPGQVILQTGFFFFSSSNINVEIGMIDPAIFVVTISSEPRPKF